MFCRRRGRDPPPRGVERIPRACKPLCGLSVRQAGNALKERKIFSILLRNVKLYDKINSAWVCSFSRNRERCCVRIWKNWTGTGSGSYGCGDAAKCGGKAVQRSGFGRPFREKAEAKMLRLCEIGKKGRVKLRFVSGCRKHLQQGHRFRFRRKRKWKYLRKNIVSLETGKFRQESFSG